MTTLETKAPTASKKIEKVEKPVYKIRLKVHSQEKSTIFRNDGFPFIDDKTENAVKWLADKGYKPEEIEILGEKPAIWEIVYPKPVVEAPIVEVPTVEAPIVETPVAAAASNIIIAVDSAPVTIDVPLMPAPSEPTPVAVDAEPLVGTLTLLNGDAGDVS